MLEIMDKQPEVTNQPSGLGDALRNLLNKLRELPGALQGGLSYDRDIRRVIKGERPYLSGREMAELFDDLELAGPLADKYSEQLNQFADANLREYLLSAISRRIDDLSDEALLSLREQTTEFVKEIRRINPRILTTIPFVGPIEKGHISDSFVLDTAFFTIYRKMRADLLFAGASGYWKTTNNDLYTDGHFYHDWYTSDLFHIQERFPDVVNQAMDKAKHLTELAKATPLSHRPIHNPQEFRWVGSLYFSSYFGWVKMPPDDEGWVQGMGWWCYLLLWNYEELIKRGGPFARQLTKEIRVSLSVTEDQEKSIRMFGAK